MVYFSPDVLQAPIDMRRYVDLARGAILDNSRILRFIMNDANRKVVRTLVRNLKWVFSDPSRPEPQVRWIEIDCTNALMGTPFVLLTLLEQGLHPSDRIRRHFEATAEVETPRGVRLADLVKGNAKVTEMDWYQSSFEEKKEGQEQQLQARTQRLLASVARNESTDIRLIVVLQQPELLGVPTWDWWWEMFWHPICSLGNRPLIQLLHQQSSECNFDDRKSPPASDLDLVVDPVLGGDEKLRAEDDITKVVADLTGWMDIEARKMAQEVMKQSSNNLSLIRLSLISRLNRLEV